MIGNQKEIPLLAEVKKPVMVKKELIESCRDGLDAIRLCIHLSSYSQEFIAEHLNIDPGHMTRMMQGRAHFPPRLVPHLMILCCNYAPVQFYAFKMGLEIKERSKDQKIRELESELARLKGVA